MYRLSLLYTFFKIGILNELAYRTNFYVQILSSLGVKFKAHDVLADDDLRQGIKAFSNWPTVPQLYVKGEFVGGCDILREMYQSGELIALLESKGVPVTVA